MFDSASPSDIIAFLQRIDSTVLAGRSPSDAWKEFLKKNSGGAGTLNDMEANWLNSKGASGSGKTSSDQNDMYMSSKGFSGDRRDKIRNYLRGSATQ